jgi:hypothetical protein
MPLRKRLIWAVALSGLLPIVALFWFYQGGPGEAVPQRRIAVMSSISLQWGEADFDVVAKGEAQPDPLVPRLAQSGQLQFVDSVARLQAAKPDVAILIQPRALSPDELVRLDSWVQAGGRLLLFADPALQWPSSLPLGDPGRPLFTSMLSPVLAHWGLELALPMDATEELVELRFRDLHLAMVSPGIWQAVRPSDTNGNCRIDADSRLAECRPGKGQVVLIADADMLHQEIWQPSLGRNDNMRLVERTIDALADGQRVVGAKGK